MDKAFTRSSTAIIILYTETMKQLPTKNIGSIPARTNSFLRSSTTMKTD